MLEQISRVDDVVLFLYLNPTKKNSLLFNNIKIIIFKKCCESLSVVRHGDTTRPKYPPTPWAVPHGPTDGTDDG